MAPTCWSIAAGSRGPLSAADVAVDFEDLHQGRGVVGRCGRRAVYDHPAARRGKVMVLLLEEGGEGGVATLDMVKIDDQLSSTCGQQCLNQHRDPPGFVAAHGPLDGDVRFVIPTQRQVHRNPDTVVLRSQHRASTTASRCLAIMLLDNLATWWKTTW